MNCPHCNRRARVIETRHNATSNNRRRRFECQCGNRFTTYEILFEVLKSRARLGKCASDIKARHDPVKAGEKGYRRLMKSLGEKSEQDQTSTNAN